MGAAKKIGWSALAVVSALAVAGMVWEPLAASDQPAPTKRTFDVEIVRDGFGVPHINGKTDADAAYGLAFAHSEDDFSTIQEVVSMARGRYGAMIGSDGANVDYAFHLLGVRDTVDRRYAEIPADVRAVLDGYAAGLNHYADKHPGEIRMSKLFPVTGKDIVAGFVLRAPFFYGLDNYIGTLVEGKKLPTESAASMTPIGRDPEMNGSNAWAVAPSRMADGKTNRWRGKSHGMRR
jgi:acyl-homoserine-lactone acylase